MKRVLFLCAGNSARSQMAEGWARRLSEGRIEAYSAGTEPAESVNGHAVEVMAEKGVDIIGHRPKRLSDIGERMDLIVAVCSQAAEKCPVPPGGTAFERWDLPDPAAAKGSKEEILEVFRASRDEIERRVRELLLRLE